MTKSDMHETYEVHAGELPLMHLTMQYDLVQPARAPKQPAQPSE